MYKLEERRGGKDEMKRTGTNNEDVDPSETNFFPDPIKHERRSKGVTVDIEHEKLNTRRRLLLVPIDFPYPIP